MNKKKREIQKKLLPYGDLIKNATLEQTAKQKAKKYYEKKIKEVEKEEYLSKDWIFARQLKNSMIIRKNKGLDGLLKDKVWLLFKNMGFTEMNKERNLKINLNTKNITVNVFAKDDNHVFIVFCKSQKTKSLDRFLRDYIKEISNLKNSLTQTIRNYYDKKLKVSFLLVTKNIIWDKKDRNLACQEHILCWGESDLEAYEKLTEQLGNSAKYQMYSILFQGKKASEVGDIKVPAICGGKGKKKYYCFVIQPNKLFPIAYVNRREKTNPKDVSNTYQRMIKKNRLNKIAEFVNKGGFFSNNLIISFTSKQKPQFEKKNKEGEITYGILKFPPYYGCAWIIDGQHRLYGYSKSEKALSHTIPVIAFESLSIYEQSNLFVEINKEQEKVSKSLLWDLYPDIYYNSEKEEHLRLRAISLIAKKLNSDKESVFYNHIQIPSLIIKNKKETNLTLTNICEAIKENRLINKEGGLLYKQDYENSVNFATERIKTYFDIIIKSLPKDWEKGEYGLLRSNVGIRIFFIIFRQLLRYLNYKEQGGTYRKANLTEFKASVKNILNPILTNLKNMSFRERDQIRGGTGKGLVIRNTQKLLWDLKEKTNFGLELWRQGGWNPGIPKEDSDEKIKELIDDSEIKLRSFIIDNLKKIHGKNWWKEGVPDGVNDHVKNIIKKDISGAPWKKEELLSCPPEKKIIKTGLPHLKEIIINKKNWKQFEEAFAKDKESLSTSFKYLENLRNKLKHPEREKELDEIEKGLGYWNMRWIRRCIGLDS